MTYTLTQAARACGKSKATLLRAIRSRRLYRPQRHHLRRTGAGGSAAGSGFR